MPQGQQVHADQHREPVAARQRVRRGGEPVEAGAVVKADVIADAHVVEAGRLDHAQQRPPPGGIGDHQAVVHGDADLAHDDSLVVPSRHLHNVLHSW
jgi:hypothetical protein